MWFKTRTGLVGVREPVEILFERFTREGVTFWAVFARGQYQQEVIIKGVLGSGKFSNPVSYLAQFLDGSEAKQSVGKCLELIATSIGNGEKICDLSRVGDTQAWSKKWQQVDWPGTSE